MSSEKITIPKWQSLPQTRSGLTRKVHACGFDMYVTVNFFENSNDPAEVFVCVAKEGSTVSGLLDVTSILISVLLRFGVAWSSFKEYIQYQQFEPRDDENSSLVHALVVAIDALIATRTELWSDPKEVLVKEQ